ncbi:MAG: hypothetical protein R6V19_15770 [Armatimonadota bacterium]
MSGRILKIVVPVVLVTAVVVAAYFWLSAEPPGDRQQIINALTSAERAAERGSVSGLLHIVSNDYTDANDNNKRQLARLARAALLEADWQVSVELHDLRIEEGAAFTEITATVWPSGTPDVRQRYDMAVQWRKEGSSWRVVSSGGWQGARADFFP